MNFTEIELDEDAPGLDAVSADSDLVDCFAKMKELGLDALPVCEGSVLIGLVTEEDILSRANSPERGALLVKEIMQSRIFCCFEDQELDEVAQSMKETGIRHLLVLDRQGNLVGLLSLSRLLSDHSSTLLC